jgi:hypothetical protein
MPSTSILSVLAMGVAWCRHRAAVSEDALDWLHVSNRTRMPPCTALRRMEPRNIMNVWSIACEALVQQVSDAIRMS